MNTALPDTFPLGKGRTASVKRRADVWDKLARVVLGFMILLGLTVGALYWSPVWTAWITFERLSIDSGKPLLKGSCPASDSWSVQDTRYPTDTTPPMLGTIYTMACRRLEALQSTGTLNFYEWFDPNGGVGRATVLQCSSGYCDVTVFDGNSGVAVGVEVALGTFDPAAAFPGGFKLVSDWHVDPVTGMSIPCIISPPVPTDPPA